MNATAESGVLFEFVTIGNSVKVIAIDEATGTEAVVVVPKNTPLPSMKMAGKRKLAYVLNKKPA